jgi:hypothetical protein
MWGDDWVAALGPQPGCCSVGCSIITVGGSMFTADCDGRPADPSCWLTSNVNGGPSGLPMFTVIPSAISTS